MANNLLKNGHEVTVMDMNTALKDKFPKAKWATNPAEAAKDADVVVTMLPASPHVRSTYAEGADNIFSVAKKGALLIDSSTIDPTTARNLSTEARAQGLKFFDAPVSGGVGGAQAGTLTFMVGAETAEEFGEAKAVLEHMGKNIVHCGGVGTGQVAKICNNMLLGISMIGVSETMNLGVKLGIDPKLLGSILNTSTGRCWSSDTYNPCPGVIETAPSNRDYEGGFGSALMLKDLGLALSAAGEVKASVPLGAVANQIYNMVCSQGLGNKDFSVTYKYLSGNKKQE